MSGLLVAAALGGFTKGMRTRTTAEQELVDANNELLQTQTDEKRKTALDGQLKEYNRKEGANEYAKNSPTGTQSSSVQKILTNNKDLSKAEWDEIFTHPDYKPVGLYELGERPNLEYLDVSNYTAPARSFWEHLTFQDKEEYDGITLTQAEADAYFKPRNYKAQAITDDDIKTSRENRDRAKLKVKLGKKGYPMYQGWKHDNKTLPPVLQKQLTKIAPNLRDQFLQRVAMGIGNESTDLTVGQAMTNALSLFSPTSQKESTSEIILDDTNSSTKLKQLVLEQKKLIAESGDANRKRDDGVIKKELDAVEKQIAQERKVVTEAIKNKRELLEARTKDINIQMQTLSNWTTTSQKQDINRMSQTYALNTPGLKDLLYVKEKDAYVTTGAGQRFVNHLVGAVDEAVKHLYLKATTDTEFSLGNLNATEAQKLALKETEQRFVDYDGMTGDAIFIVPFELVPFGASIDKEAWQEDFRKYMGDEANFYTGDEDAQRKALEYRASFFGENPRALPGNTQEVVTPPQVSAGTPTQVRGTINGVSGELVTNADGSVDFIPNESPTATTSPATDKVDKDYTTGPALKLEQSKRISKLRLDTSRKIAAAKKNGAPPATLTQIKENARVEAEKIRVDFMNKFKALGLNQYGQ